MKKLTIITTAVISTVLVGISCLAFNRITDRKNTSDKKAGIVATEGSGITDADDKSSSDFTYVSPSANNSKNDNTKDNSTSFVPNRKLNLNRNSITFLVNKEYSLPKNYVPKNMVVPNVRFDVANYDDRKQMRPEAAQALEETFTAAERDGYYLVGVSAYRSYHRQYDIFINNIVTKGKTHTLRYSAVPGTSEHQTGLAIDVTSESLHNRLDETFASTPEGKWLAVNAHKFGFIVRYPKNKEDITGYAYEPWHIRYVGRALATYLYKHDMTLDEYYRYKPSQGFNFETMYASLINYRPTPTPSPIPLPTATPTPIPSITPTPTPTKIPKNEVKVTPTPTQGAEDTVTPTIAPNAPQEAEETIDDSNKKSEHGTAGNNGSNNDVSKDMKSEKDQTSFTS